MPERRDPRYAHLAEAPELAAQAKLLAEQEHPSLGGGVQGVRREAPREAQQRHGRRRARSARAEDAEHRAGESYVMSKFYSNCWLLAKFRILKRILKERNIRKKSVLIGN